MSGDFFWGIIAWVVSTMVIAHCLWFGWASLTWVLRLIRSGIIHLRNKRPQLPEDGYHRPDHSDDKDAVFPKKSLLDWIDDFLRKWIEKINELKK